VFLEDLGEATQPKSLAGCCRCRYLECRIDKEAIVFIEEAFC
jgi:hypothetical protein